MKKTLRFTLEMEVDLLGADLSDDDLNGMVIDQLNDSFPNVILDPVDDDHADVFVDSWCYEAVKPA